MTVELRPYGVACNIACCYCYQNPQRQTQEIDKLYDIEMMKVAVEKEGEPFILFGGEPLLMPERDLEELWSWGLQRFGSNGIQTNGTLINENHVRMFRKYQVSVGISIDGPGELNDARWAGTLPATRNATEQTQRAIGRLCREGVRTSIIVTLHRLNATSARLPTMNLWLHHLDELGIADVRLHILESESRTIRNRFGLSNEENIRAFLNFAELEKDLGKLRFDVFRDIRRLLLGKDRSITCVWSGCDPYTTLSVRGVEGMGQRSNCGRVNKEGINFSKASRVGFERYLALYRTPQEDGGCEGCRFFLMCKGQCPGTAIDGDWRNKTEHCEVWKALFQHFEEELLGEGCQPISLSSSREVLEQRFLQAWSCGRAETMENLHENRNKS